LTRPRPLSDRERLQLGESVVEFAAQDPLKSRLIDNLRHALNHDHLTGLLIKPRFDEELEQALARTKEKGEPLSVIMADVDNLKETNEEHGHLMGELAVGEIGRTIGRFHESDGRGATRFGGDETKAYCPERTPLRKRAWPRASAAQSRNTPSSATAPSPGSPSLWA
jgi:two-component system cell cycle response regulator